MMSGGEARRRINAIKQYSSLGAGFKIAMRDLEIRGAGNILGTQQSGHIVTIGFDLYCALLKQAIAKLKGEKVRPRLEVILRTDCVATREADWRGAGIGDRRSEIGTETPKKVSPAQRNRRGTMPIPTAPQTLTPDLRAPTSDLRKAPAFLPQSYIAESQPRIQAYRRLAEVTAQEQLDALRKTWRDRFGILPEAAENLLVMTEIKIAASARKMTIVELREDKVMLTRNNAYVQIDGKFPRVSAPDPGERLREVLRLVRAF
jgi:transcription-repair coupling factor (superfamily II helicase)